jgi:hypothetical protein
MAPSHPPQYTHTLRNNGLFPARGAGRKRRTSPNLCSKEILISPGKIDRISYEDATVFVYLTKADIQQTAENQVATAGAEN